MSTKTAPAKRLTATKKKAPKVDLKKEMAKNAKVIQSKGSRKELAFGARDGKFEIVPKKKEIVIASVRPINDIIASYFTFRDDGSGVEISKDLEAPECARSIQFFSKLEEVSNFVVGDLIAFAQHAYLEGVYEAMMKATGIGAGSLANIASTARSVAPEIRNEKLSFTHHVAIAKLPPAQQKKLLSRAAKEDLSVAELKREVAIVAPPRPTKPRSVKAKAVSGKGDELPARDDFEMSREALEKDERAIEKADAALLYVKSSAFHDLNAKARDAWKSLLMQFSDAYEKLLRA